MKAITIDYIKSLKNNSEPFPTITAYDYISAQIIDDAGLPLILVGDSASMMVYGYNTTIPISIDEMLLLVKAVAKGALNALVVADMPFLSYQPSIEETIKNAGRLIKEGNANAVKLEGGKHMYENIKSLVNIGIPVMGHVGLTPQSYNQMSGYKIQGKTDEEAQNIIDDAIAVEEAGAFSIVLECIPEKLAKQITKKLKIPTIGIGSGSFCNGQIQVFHDVVGLQKNKPPKHAMVGGNLYNETLQIITDYKNKIKKL